MLMIKITMNHYYLNHLNQAFQCLKKKKVKNTHQSSKRILEEDPSLEVGQEDY